MALLYNMVDSLYKHRHSDSEIDLFLQVLLGEIHEQVYLHLSECIEHVEVLVNQADHKHIGQVPELPSLQLIALRSLKHDYLTVCALFSLVSATAK